MPIGEEPSGRSWTGFQSILNADEGYLIVYREDNEKSCAEIATWLDEDDSVELKPVIGTEESSIQRVGANGSLTFTIQSKNSFQLYHYKKQ